MLGHHQHHPVAAHRRRHRERNAGVARRRLDQRIAGLDRTASFRLEDHRQRGAILDRSGGIVALELRQQHIVRLARQALQPNERRIADGAFDGLIHGARYAFKKFYCTANKNPALRAGPEKISRRRLLLCLFRSRLVILCFFLGSRFIFLGFFLGGCFVGLGLLLGGRFIGLRLLLGGRFIGLRLLFVRRLLGLVLLGHFLVALHRLVVLLGHLLVGLHRLVVLLGRGRCRRLGRRARNRHGLRRGWCGLGRRRRRDGRARLHILRPGRGRRCGFHFLGSWRGCRCGSTRDADLPFELTELTLLDARHLHDVFGCLERAVLGAIVD